MPHPTQGETEKDFLKRCIPEVMHEGTTDNNKQAVAICYSMYRREGTEEKSPKPEKKHNMDMPEPSSRKSDSMEYYAYEHPYGHRHPNYKHYGHMGDYEHHGEHHGHMRDYGYHHDHHDHHHDHHDHHHGEITDYSHARRVGRRRGYIAGSQMDYSPDTRRKVKYAANRYL